MKRYWYFIIIFAAAISIQAVHVNKDKLYEIAKNIEIFTNVYKELNTNYVDELDPSELMRTGIDAMVESLDPYTRYISEAQIESFRISTEGKYSGIGAVIRKVDSVLTVIEAYENGPAIKAGLQPGDQVLTVNGEETLGKDSEDVRNVMRGAPGTTVELGIKRFGMEDPFTVEVERGEVSIPNVPHYELMEDDIAYVHLSKFSQNAGQNIRNALFDMSKDTELNGVVLDLRNNGGGLLREAIAVTNIFVDKDIPIVSTRGKVYERDRVYKTTMTALDTTVPLIVLINDHSASASEIVSGSIQDLDRGILIGQKSYGKGLVQNTKKVGYNSQVKLTTSKYYIPSGRCIQSVAYKNGEPVDIPVEERNKFTTRKGRLVLDGGGIQPDVKMIPEDLPEFVKFLLRENMIFKFANEYCAPLDSIAPVDEYEFSDYDQFVAFYHKMDPHYESVIEHKFNDFKKAYTDEFDEENIHMELSDILPGEDELLRKYQQKITSQIGREIIGRYYFVQGKVRYALRNDPELNEAVQLLNNMNRYKEILSAEG